MSRRNRTVLCSEKWRRLQANPRDRRPLHEFSIVSSVFLRKDFCDGCCGRLLLILTQPLQRPFREKAANECFKKLFCVVQKLIFFEASQDGVVSFCEKGRATTAEHAFGRLSYVYCQPRCLHQSPCPESAKAGRPIDVRRSSLNTPNCKPVCFGLWETFERPRDLHKLHKLIEGRPQEASKLHLAGEFKIQMGFGNVTEQEASLYGPHVWTGGCEDLHHCQKKALWMDIMELFDCCATSTWLSCDIQVRDGARRRCPHRLMRYFGLSRINAKF